MHQEDEKNRKQFTLKDNIKSMDLNKSQVDKIFAKYNIASKSSSCILTLESFTNNLDDKIDYDVSIKCVDTNNTYPLKTDGSLSKIENYFDSVVSFSNES